MAVVQVRDLPPEVVDTLRIRAARAHQSLQGYLLQLLIDHAGTLTPVEAAERARDIAGRSSATILDIAQAQEALNGKP
ncbi:FitA-like ribbon-helix-helix domain-containing protein [Streptomyces sp. NPDC086796]|uniref:FitA-like ribbon-helix-helix domain-containing protein n=1 Tax=Streptomyces sp. NPDC086796 TaxID=3365760 RepID=UPI0037FC1B68